MTVTELSRPTVSSAALGAFVSADGGAAVVTLRGAADLSAPPMVVEVPAPMIAESDAVAPWR
jgi:hypothetical protein